MAEAKFWVHRWTKRIGGSKPEVIGFVKASAKDHARKKLGVLFHGGDMMVGNHIETYYLRSSRHKTRYFVSLIKDETLLEKINLKEITSFVR